MNCTTTIHLAAQVRTGAHSICEPESARWLWLTLRRAFPDAYGCTLMPDHIHLVTRVKDAGGARRRVTAILGHHTRNFGTGESIWKPTAEPTPVANARILRRTLRYLALNPCRAHLVPDPLAWMWSTHRDVMGAVCDPWITATDLARAVGWSPAGFRRRYHAFVSSDWSVKVDGTPVPLPASGCDYPQLPVARLIQAVQAATRKPAGAIRQRGPVRSLFIHLAMHQGWRDRQVLIGATGANISTIKRILERPLEPDFLTAGLLCLNDPRLRWPVK